MSKTQPTTELQTFLNELGNMWPLAKGSLTFVRKPCIRPNCTACRSGRKHQAILFSFTKRRKRFCRYVPTYLEPLLRRALANGRRLEERLVELGEELLQRYRQQRG